MERLKHQYFIVAEGVVAGGDDFFSRLQAFKNFVVLRVLAADADFAAYCLAPVRGDNEDPFAACLLVEGS